VLLGSSYAQINWKPQRPPKKAKKKAKKAAARGELMSGD
jgi:hypothetical protein